VLSLSLRLSCLRLDPFSSTNMRSHFSFALAALVSQAFAGDDQWLSPVYKEIFRNPLPFPPDKAPKYQYKNETTGGIIDYYEVEVKTFKQQVYPGLKPATLYGYDGVSPGPTFRMVWPLYTNSLQDRH